MENSFFMTYVFNSLRAAIGPVIRPVRKTIDFFITIAIMSSIIGFVITLSIPIVIYLFFLFREVKRIKIEK